MKVQVRKDLFNKLKRNKKVEVKVGTPVNSRIFSLSVYKLRINLYLIKFC